jgi:hypothetical protein
MKKEQIDHIKKLIQSAKDEIATDELREKFFQAKYGEGKDKNYFFTLLMQATSKKKINQDWLAYLEKLIK